jgi:predicted phosphodiesterase
LIIARLGKLPSHARLPLEGGLEAVVVHGSPADPTEAMCPEMEDDELAALLGDNPGDLVICGASHVPFTRMIGDVQIVSVGSVGQSPAEGFAHASIIDASESGIGIEQFDVEL